jgi:hypothetical protein
MFTLFFTTKFFFLFIIIFGFEMEPKFQIHSSYEIHHKKFYLYQYILKYDKFGIGEFFKIKFG